MMSEPMSSGEIEDVLSSIRRLVSEDMRPAPPPLLLTETPTKPPSGKLLLTPALRVVSNDVPGADLPVPGDATRAAREIGAAVGQSDPEWEQELGDGPFTAKSWKAPDWVEDAEVAENSVEAAERDAVVRALADKAEAAAVAEIAARAAEALAHPVGESPAKIDPAAEAAQQLFDEEVLRGLVRDLIREELSGSLGERITRNIRKLVRAEINRAMTARDTG